MGAMVHVPRYTTFSLSVKHKVEAYLLLPKPCQPPLHGQKVFSNPDSLDPSNNNLGNGAGDFSPRVLCGSEGWQASTTLGGHLGVSLGFSVLWR